MTQLIAFLEELAELLEKHQAELYFDCCLEVELPKHSLDLHDIVEYQKLSSDILLDLISQLETKQ